VAFFLTFANFDSSWSNPIAYFEFEMEDSSLAWTLPSFNAVPFDVNSEFYICADKDGASPVDCTISQVILEYRSYPSVMSQPQYGHLGGTSNRMI